MFVIYDEIRLDPTAKSLQLNETDWAINPKQHCMQHDPTQTVFRICVDEKATEAEPLTVMDFSAHLVALGEGQALPAPDVIESLGRNAIGLYLLACGFLTRRTETGMDLPSGIENAYEC